MEIVRTEEVNIYCLKCQEKMVLQKAEVNYRNYYYPVELMTCPKCGQIYVSEKVQQKMLLVQENLEEK
ncbi:MAG: hypothetical protein PHN35_05615 [Clostridia bacterium]|nr:hypothetical protein [Clostridia bacterium]